MRKFLLGAIIGAVVGVGLNLVVGLVETGVINRNGAVIGAIEPWRSAVWVREDWRDWRNFYALGIISGAAVGMLWVRFATRGQTPDAPAAGMTINRTLRKISLGVVLLLAVVGGSLVIMPVRYVAFGWCRGENFYHGLPKGYWIEQLKSACQPPVNVQPDAQFLVAFFGGMAVEGLIKIVAEDIKKDAVPDLVEMLHDPNPIARDVAAITLRRIGPEAADATPALIDAAKNDQHARVRLNAALALVEIGTGAQNAIPTLLDAIQDKNLMLTPRWQAGEALGKLGPEAKDAVPALIEFVRKNDHYYGGPALEALKKIDADAAAKHAPK